MCCRNCCKGHASFHPDEKLEPASPGAICQQRQQLGVAPLSALFHQVCCPLATQEHRDAFLFGLRLMAIDGTAEDVPDTPTNARYFGGDGRAATAPFRKSVRSICVNAGRTRFVMPASGLTACPNGWAVCGCCARWAPACWPCGIAAFRVMICVPGAGNEKPTFSPVCQLTCS